MKETEQMIQCNQSFLPRKIGVASKAAVVIKSKSQPHSAGRISVFLEPRPVFNQEIKIYSKATEHVILDVHSFTSVEQIKSTRIELANGMVVTSSGKGSITVSKVINGLHSVRFIIYRTYNSFTCGAVDLMIRVLPRASRRVIAGCTIRPIIMNYCGEL